VPRDELERMIANYLKSQSRRRWSFVDGLAELQARSPLSRHNAKPTSEKSKIREIINPLQRLHCIMTAIVAHDSNF